MPRGMSASGGALSDKVRELREEPYPDVYAAACVIRSSTFGSSNANGQRVHAFRGQRDATWNLIPSIQRDIPAVAEDAEKELRRRYYVLALFCEAMRLYLDREALDSSEATCMAIAQHYGVPSPLCDLTWSPWVALFFASHGAQAGQIGIVQRFSISTLQEISGQGAANLGTLQIIEAEFVPRIKAQRGFFIEFPTHRLDKQLVAPLIRFLQVPGMVFHDDDLGITEDLIYPPTAQDRFAGLSRPRLQRFSGLMGQQPTSATQYFAHAKAWRPEDVAKLDFAQEAVLRDACEFHFRLQSLEGLPDYLRSLSRFQSVER